MTQTKVGNQSPKSRMRAQLPGLFAVILAATTALAAIGALFFAIFGASLVDDANDSVSGPIGGSTPAQPRNGSAALTPESLDEFAPEDAAETLADLDRRLRELEATLAALSDPPADGIIGLQLDSMNLEVDDLESDLQGLDGRLNEIEDALLDDAGNALRVPLLADDLDDLATTHAAGMEAVRADSDRTWTVMQWTLIAIATAAVTASLTLLATTIRRWMNAQGDSASAPS